MEDYDFDYFKSNTNKSNSNTPRRASASSTRGRRSSSNGAKQSSSSTKSTRGTANRKRRATAKGNSSNSSYLKTATRSTTRKAVSKKTAPKSSSRRTYTKSNAPKTTRTKTKATPKRQIKKPNIKISPKVKKIIIGVCVAAFVVVIGCMVATTIRNNDINYKKSQPFRFSSNVSISGIGIGGLSYDEAVKKIDENEIDAVKDVTINLTARNYKTTLNKNSFSYTFSIKKALKEAKVYSLKEQGIYEYKKGESTDFTRLDPPDFKLSYTVDKSSVTSKVKQIASKVDVKAINAKVAKFTPFAENRFTYKDGSVGYALDKKDLQTKFTNALTGKSTTVSIAAKVNKVNPTITLNDVKTKIVGLSTYSNVSTNNANGNHNMKTALAACNGSVIEPGATWSFNDCTGNTNLESNGYKKAEVINNKKVEQGVGGGLCQASTLIFDCGLYANMAIIERHNHYWASTYAFAGEDATIDYPNLDLRMQNTTDYQMFIECRMVGTTLTCNIYGYQDPSYDNIKTVSTVSNVVEGSSYSATLTRNIYLKHELIRQETICSSTYSLTNNVSARPEDTGTYRKTVDGNITYEVE